MNKYTKFNIPFTNIFFIRWYPKTKTIIHNHPASNNNLMVLKGKLNENIYKELNDNSGYYMIDSKILNQYQSSYINNNIGSHNIINLSDTYSWSIHYSK